MNELLSQIVDFQAPDHASVQVAMTPRLEVNRNEVLRNLFVTEEEQFQATGRSGKISKNEMLRNLFRQ